ncbi:secretin N-terminal domain-containing protein [Massilia aquatica]|uniref:General secretion pathway protein GspD n=1 Tax=Massilia aquatica TaxID=2609000 RepID=A0ABX0M1I7_9BURK|nr:secretin N-terminal domain-containing protein [Massilia aquatica]NHZ41008.1 general secretion pathway protein GspD [Massilia aquatica]
MASHRIGTRCLHLPPWRRLARAAAVPLMVPLMLLALSGCAGRAAYLEGNSLVEKDEVEAGLIKYREAVDAQPENPVFRAAYLRARERAATRLLDQADRALAAGRPAPALQDYQRVLGFDPANERARAGLRLIEMDQRHTKAMEEAAAAFERKDYEPARARAAAILVERPQYEPARQLLQEIAEKTAAPVAETGLAAAYKTPISIEFRDAPLKQVLDVIARRSNLNFIFDKDVKTDQKTSIFLKNSTVESAIYYLMVSNQLDYQIMDGNTLLVYQNVATKLKEYQEMTVKTFFLANADAKVVANTLKTILKSRDVVIDEKLNLVIVRDNPEAIKLAAKLVALQDVAEPEVMLEVEILEIKRSRLLELGVAWPTSLTLAPLTAAGGGPLTLDTVRGLGKADIGLSSLSTTITARKTDGDSNTLANPRIRVRNKEKAKIVIGDKVPNITTTLSSGGVANGFSQESITYLDVGLTLNVEPTIYLNNEIGIRVGLTVSSLLDTITTASGTTAYRIGNREASTMLQLKDGENQVLAGLINNEDRSSGTKIPGVGNLPVVGRLFGRTADGADRTEIVLSITPHLIRNIQRPPASASEFSAGTETSFRRRPDTTPRAPVLMPPSPGVRAPVPAPAPVAPDTPAAAVTPVPVPETTPAPQQ